MNTELHSNLIHRVNVGDSLTRAAARFPERPAIVDGERRFSYVELNAWVNRVAHRLMASGYSRGDALALASRNSAEFLVTYYACAKIGVVCVPINLGWGTDEVAYVLEHSEARGLLVEQHLLEETSSAVGRVPGVRDVFLAEELAELETDDDSEPEVVVGDRDPITYLYTSGTTSAPKGVVGNHTAIYLESMTMALEAKFDERDRFVAMMPMFHTAQLNCHCTAAVMVGACLYIERAFEAGRLLSIIESERITQIFGLPMMYRAMLEHPDINTRDLTSLRRALYAMAPMPEAQLRQCLQTFGCDFYLLFGQTEMSPTATLFRPEHQVTHNGAAGTPVVNVQVGIMDDEGTLLPTGAQGEIVYRGPHTMTEYLKNAEATDTAFRNGWFHSGDVGAFDADGLLWFRDRTKDVIKSGGENVASIEVEKAIYAVAPGVAEVVVVGLPHDRWTEAITAVVVPRAGAIIDTERLIADVKKAIGSLKAPKAVIVVDALPRTSTGKIQKNLVRDELRHHYASSGV